jgi:urea transporter/murein DD-endopeptidase MepM/ murein hydrolase activator NlpD
MYRNIWHNPLLRETLVPAVLNSYSVVFFLNNRILALVLLLVSFLNPTAGLAGLLSVLLTVLTAYLLGLDKFQLRNGVLTFNSLLTGLAMGTFYKTGWVFFGLLATSALLALLLSTLMTKWFFSKGLPFLSLPFILTFWMLLAATGSFENLAFNHNELLWENAGHTNLIEIYLRSLSSVFFLNSPLAGACIALALLIGSRIHFVLSILSMLTAWCLSLTMGVEAANFTYYNVGANYMMLAFAVGGFFYIPSKSSYLWALLLIPITSVVLIVLQNLALPLFSLPFVLVVVVSVLVLRMRPNPRHLLPTYLQLYSPESNLYTVQNDRIRYARFQYKPLRLPFWGPWTVTQGYDGEHTHIGDWGQALDFQIFDQDDKTYATHGLSCDDYHCYGKPVLAPADGRVVDLCDGIEDNALGEVNTVQNWGNSLVIQHLEGVCTQLSHLRKGSFKVAVGDFVHKGDVLATCGNSGRSPQPHLHVQVQQVPLIGAKTIPYPFAYVLNKAGLTEFEVPKLDELVADPPSDRLLRKAFDIQPNQCLTLGFEDEKGQHQREEWLACTDAYNYKYLYCKASESVAYYYLDDGMFYFTAYYGPKTSLLHAFYLAAYKVNLTSVETVVSDVVPFNLLQNHWLIRWINDFAAPFHNRVQVQYASSRQAGILRSDIRLKVGKTIRPLSDSCIYWDEAGLVGFDFTSKTRNIVAKCLK